MKNMNCKKCNNPLSNDTKFCAKCGEKVISESKPVSEQKTGKKSALTSIVSVVVFILAFAVVRYLTQQTISPSTNSSTQSVAELANEAVRQVKASTTFPNKLDAATTWVDITAEQNAIRYHYVLSGIDTSSLSNAYLKNYLGSSICQNKDTRNLLDRGVGMEYSYAVENTTQSYFVSFTKTDCLQ